MFGAQLRCEDCNQYKPDRCICTPIDMPKRGTHCEVLLDGQYQPARFVTLDLVGLEPIVQQDRMMPIFATWGTVRGLKRPTLPASKIIPQG